MQHSALPRAPGVSQPEDGGPGVRCYSRMATTATLERRVTDRVQACGAGVRLPQAPGVSQLRWRDPGVRCSSPTVSHDS
jgi:hypothetical protein